MKTEDRRTPWKEKIHELCDVWSVSPPVFMFTRRELRKILRNKSKWEDFKQRYPYVFDGDDWKEGEIKSSLKDVIAIDDRYIKNKNIIRHEFAHLLSQELRLFDEREEEEMAAKFVVQYGLCFGSDLISSWDAGRKESKHKSIEIYVFFVLNAYSNPIFEEPLIDGSIDIQEIP